MTAWQLVHWKDVSVGAKYMIFRIESVSFLNVYKD